MVRFCPKQKTGSPKPDAHRFFDKYKKRILLEASLQLYHIERQRTILVSTILCYHERYANGVHEWGNLGEITLNIRCVFGARRVHQCSYFYREFSMEGRKIEVKF